MQSMKQNDSQKENGLANGLHTNNLMVELKRSVHRDLRS